MWTTLIIHGYVHRYSLNNYESDNYPLPSTKFLSSNRKTWFLPVRWSPNWALAALVNGKRPSLPRRLGAVEGESLWNQSLLGALYRKKHLWISVTPTKMPKNTTDVQCVKIWNNLHLFLKALACTVDSHTTTNLQRYISSPFFLMKQTMVSPSFVPPWNLTVIWLHQEEFLGKLKGIKGISMVETQTYTLEEANENGGWPGWPGDPKGCCEPRGGGFHLGEALRISGWKPNGKIRGITTPPFQIKLWLPWLRPWGSRGWCIFVLNEELFGTPESSSHHRVDGSLNTSQ